MQLKEEHKQALYTVGNLGFTKAGSALSALLQKNLSLKVPEVRTTSFSDIISAVDSPDATQVAVFLHVEGDTPGKVALFFPIQSAEYIVQTLFASDKAIDLFTDPMAHSALMEVGNIMVSSFVSALADFTSLNISPSTPAIAIDMVGAIIEAILVQDGVLDDDVLLMRTLIEGTSLIQGQLVFFPNAGSLNKLLGALPSCQSL